MSAPGVAIIFALSAGRRSSAALTRARSRPLIALVALLLSGTYSVTAALGQRCRRPGECRRDRDGHHGRPQQGASGLRRRQGRAGHPRHRQAGERPAGPHSAAQAELAKLPPARPAAEIDAMIRGAAMRPNAGQGCTAINGSLRMSCPKLEAEKARAEQRERLTGKIAGWTAEVGQADQRHAGASRRLTAAMDRASADLASIQPARVANSDANALARYLGALGLEVSPDRLNDLLVLLAVVMIEAGGGLSLAIGMALQEPARGSVAASLGVPAGHSGQPRTAPAATADALPATAPDTGQRSLDMASGPRTCATATHMAGAVGVQLGLAGEILDRLRLSGGRTEGVRCLAGQLGRARSTVSDECHRLVEAGRLTMTPGRRGTVLALAARPN